MAARGFSKRMRLGSRRTVDAVFRRGRYHRLGLLHAKTLIAEGPHSRFLISVKKAIGSAPQRNRIKRLVREAIRLNRHQLERPHDVCLFLTAPLAKPPRLADVEQEVLKLFRQLGTSR